jgi:drug/metabolite transporter (DMT)-like permease
MILIFGLHFLIASAVAFMSYKNSFKLMWWFMPLGIFLSVLGSTLWMYVAKITIDANKLAILGLYWDSILTLTYIAVPILFFSARFNFNQTLGIVFIIIGILLTKEVSLV